MITLLNYAFNYLGRLTVWMNPILVIPVAVASSIKQGHIQDDAIIIIATLLAAALCAEWSTRAKRYIESDCNNVRSNILTKADQLPVTVLHECKSHFILCTMYANVKCALIKKIREHVMRIYQLNIGAKLERILTIL